MLILPGKLICSLIGDSCHGRRQSCTAGCRVAMQSCLFPLSCPFACWIPKHMSIWKKGGDTGGALSSYPRGTRQHIHALGFYRVWSGPKFVNFLSDRVRGLIRKDLLNISTVRLCSLLSKFLKWLSPAWPYSNK